jgi:flavodoxin I
VYGWQLFLLTRPTFKTLRRQSQMKVLVAYMSQTGNTRKVAEAIYEAIECDKEIKRIQEVKGLGGVDLAFLGFPVHSFGPDGKTRRFLQRQARGKIALFITHASPEGAEELQGWLEKFRDAAAGATVVGTFDCQGELAKGVKRIMSIMPDPKLRLWAKLDDSQGQPDAARLEKARVFARETVKAVSQAK